MNHMERVSRVRSMLRQVSLNDDLESVPMPGPEEVSGAESIDVSGKFAGHYGGKNGTPAPGFGYTDASEGVRKLQERRDDEVTPAELLGIEAIVLTRGRPAVFVRGGTYDHIGGIWSELDTSAVRQRIDPLLGAIGRIELPNMPSVPYGGTGFLVGPSLLMTNRHVARLFAEGLGTQHLVYRPGDAMVDFKREVDSDPDRASEFSVERVLMIHPYWDMALVKVAGLSPDYRPLTLSVKAPEDMLDRDLVVVGYPARDPRNDLALQDRIFEGVYNVKRLQPGKVRPRNRVRSFENTVDAMVHDSSTLGGNSGSALIDVSNGRIIGLHFAGEYLKANYAVPSYELARDARVRDAGVQFDGRIAVTDLWQGSWPSARGRETALPGDGAAQPQPQPQPNTISQQATIPMPTPDAGVIQIPLSLRITVDVAGATGGSIMPGQGQRPNEAMPLPVQVPIVVPPVAPATGRISMRQLQELARDPNVDDAELQRYFIANPAVSKPFAPAVIPNPALVDVAEPLDNVEGAMLMSWANGLSRLRRKEKFRARMAQNDRRPVLVSEGDSWFQFPMLLDDVIDNLLGDYNVWSVDAAGDTLQNMVHDNAEYMQALRRNAGSVKAFLFSGGGNDIVGEDARGRSVVGQIVRHFEQGRPAAWYIDTPAVEEKFRFIEDCYRRVLENVTREFPELPIVCHGYDYVIPGGAPGDTRRPGWAAADKWLGKPMREQLGIHDNALCTAIVQGLIDRFNETLQRLCGGSHQGGQFRNAWHIDVRRTVNGRWADELHPTNEGFAAVTSLFRKALDTALREPGARTRGERGDTERTPNAGDDAEAVQMLDGMAGASDFVEAVPGWRVAQGLTTLRNQINALAPRRSKASDGSIGDAAHRTRDSDHNPWVQDGGTGVVTALDITHDPANGCSAEKLAQSLQTGRDPRVKYVIWNRRIMSASAINGAAPWTWRAYNGKNPHNHHLHISVKPEKAAYDSTAAWNIAV